MVVLNTFELDSHEPGLRQAKSLRTFQFQNTNPFALKTCVLLED